MINNNKELQQNLDDQYTRIDPEQQLNSHWKYDGPSSFNLEKKHYPRMSNNESYYKNDEPIKINHTDFNIDTYNKLTLSIEEASKVLNAYYQSIDKKSQPA